MIRNGINFMLKPPKNLKCPICGKKCYLHERTGKYACIDSNCDFAYERMGAYKTKINRTKESE